MKFEYKTTEERDEILEEQEALGHFLLEEQNITEGNFLIFGKEPNPGVEQSITLEERIKELEAVIDILLGDE